MLCSNLSLLSVFTPFISSAAQRTLPINLLMVFINLKHQSADGVYPPDDEAMQQISHPGSD